jgi:poly(glycerol-phosphate) alpha-glucosyltransferase
MHFFVNENLAAQGSGIEHAQIQRQKLFRKYGTPSKVVTRTYNPNGHRDLLAWELLDHEVLNLFDFYAGTESVEEKIVLKEDVNWGGHRQVTDWTTDEMDPSGATFLAFEDATHQRLLGRVHTDPAHENRVTVVEVFEHFGNLYRVDTYDSRGFVSREQLMDPDGKINVNIYLDKHGKPFLEEFIRVRAPRQTEVALRARKADEQLNANNMAAQEKHQEPHQLTQEEVQKAQEDFRAPIEFPAAYRLTKPSGLVYMLDTFDDLASEFLNDLNNIYFSKERANVFIMDRTSNGEDGILKLDRPAYTAFHIHNLHASDTRDVMTTEENNNYEFGFAHYNDYNAFLSATPRQSKDIKKRYQLANSKAVTIPVGIVPERIREFDRKPVAERPAGSILMIVRRAPDKRINGVLGAILSAKKKRKDLPMHLDVYGYYDNTGQNKTIRDILAMYDKYGFTRPQLLDANGQPTEDLLAAQKIDDEFLTIHDYVTDREELYEIHRNHQIYGLDSIMEGFNISMMEAMANGLVGVSTDVNYGPNDLILNGKNGYLTAWAPDGEEGTYTDEMGERLIELFDDPKKLQKFSDAAYDNSDRYYEETVWGDWQSFESDVEKQWKKMVKTATEPSIHGNGINGSDTTDFYPIGARAYEDLAVEQNAGEEA